MGQYNNNFLGHKAKEDRYSGAYTPNYGLNKKFIFSHKANMDHGSPIKYKPYDQRKIAGLPVNHVDRKTDSHDVMYPRATYNNMSPRRTAQPTPVGSFLNTSIAK